MEAHRRHPKMGRELYRRSVHIQTANKLAGCPLAIECGPDGVFHLVDEETGEVLDPEVGTNTMLFHAGAHMVTGLQDRWLGVRAPKKEGEDPAFLGGSTSCLSSRLDPDYQERLRRKARKETFAALDLVKAVIPVDRRKHVSLKFATFTAPPCDAPRMQHYEIQNEAHKIMRGRTLWRENVYGGVRAIEDSGVDRPHVHDHDLIYSEFLVRTAWAWEWTDSYLEATEKVTGVRPQDPREEAGLLDLFDLPLLLEMEEELFELKKKAKRVRNSGKRASLGAINHEIEEMEAMFAQIRSHCFFIDIRAVVRGKAKAETQISYEDAVTEVVKYAVKSADLLKMATTEILVMEDTARWPKLFERLGAAHGNSKRGEAMPGLKEAQDASASTRLDTAAPFAEPEEGCEASPGPNEALDPDEDQASGVDPPFKKPRPPSWRALAKTLTMSEFLRVVARRAASARVQTIRRMNEAGIETWLLSEVLERNLAWV